MPKQKEIDGAYLACARNFAAFSKSRRKQVGAVLVTQNSVVLPGYNGTPASTDNNCEFETETGLVTKPEVIHAELNCILKAAKEGVNVQGSTVYVTLSPCVPCAAMLVQAGVKRVVYEEEYRSLDGVNYLKDKIQVERFERF